MTLCKLNIVYLPCNIHL